ncbi:MAG: hypothetical protein JXA74_01045, partial [Anaerolineae bacterium]|nr:hypothetical protein [Anaerolineae bacterium]
EFKRHYTLVTDCLRVYIEGRYQVPAMDRTSYELLRDLERMAPPQETVAILRALLNEADLVKFARAQPSVAAAHEALARARTYVDLSRPAAYATAAAQAPVTGSVAGGSR